MKINSKKLKYGSASTVFIALFIVLMIVINIFAGLLGDRFMAEFDMTQTGLFDLSDATVELLSSMTQDVTITIMDTETFTYTKSTYSSSVEARYLDAFPELFKRYEHFSNGHLTVKYIDPYVNPNALQQYADLGSLKATDMVIEGPYRSVLLSSYDFFVISTDTETSYVPTQYVSGLQAESQLDNALVNVTTERISGARFVKGHNETAMAALSDLLSASNYEVADINLSIEDISDSVTMLVISAPTADFSDDEIEKLDAYFQRSGDAIILFDPTTPEMPNFERYLGEWGVKPQRLMVLDDTRAINYQNNIVADIISQEMTKELTGSGLLTVSPSSIGWEILWESNQWHATYPILKSSSSSYGRALDSDAQTMARVDEDVSGPFNVMVEAKLYDPNHEIDSKILLGSTYAAADSLLQSGTFANKQLFNAALKDFNDEGVSVVVVPKQYISAQLTIQSGQAKTIFYALVVVLPLSLLAAGLVIWLRRRNK